MKIQASVGIILSEIYELQDCYVYNDCTTSSIESVFTVPSSVKNSTYDISSTGWEFGNLSAWTDIPMSITNPDLPFEVSIKIIELTSTGLTLNVGKNGNTWKSFASRTNGTLHLCGTDVEGVSLNSVYSLKCYSNKIELYKDGTLLQTHNAGLTTVQIMFGSGANRILRIKDFKIRPL